MRAHLGPVRELRVRRREPPQHRAMRILWSVATVVVGLVALGLTATGLETQRGSQGPGSWIARMIVVGSALVLGLLELRRSASRLRKNE
jgi:lysylphosphatidylglycerol synthetase-like protein (DUF2156 family)